jgi:hypothetical protein
LGGFEWKKHLILTEISYRPPFKGNRHQSIRRNKNLSMLGELLSKTKDRKKLWVISAVVVLFLLAGIVLLVKM